MMAASSSIKSADETGYPLARARVPSTRHSEVTQAVNDTIQFFRKAGADSDDAILARLGC
jgi:hypothetical protein